jgi:predicted ATPase
MSVLNAFSQTGLTKIYIENFKGIGSEVQIDLKPITLLFGANSVGKSTIMQALQYVREVLERNNANPDRTLQGGDFVDLGGFRNLVHLRDTTRHIAIQIDLSLGGQGLPDLVPEAFDDWQTDDSRVWAFYNLLHETRNRIESVSVKLVIAWSHLRDQAVVIGYQVGANGEWLAEINATDDGRDVSISINEINSIFMHPFTQKDLDKKLDYLQKNANSIVSGDTGAHTIETHYTIWPHIIETVTNAGMERTGEGLREWLSGFDSALPRLGELLHIPAPDVIGAENVYIAREFTAFISSLIVGPGLLMRDELRRMRYVGPIRHVPARDFDASLTKDEAGWADGLAGWETLLTGQQSLIDDVSRWMADEDKLNTGYAIERRWVREVRSEWLDLIGSDELNPQRKWMLYKAIESLLTKPRIGLIDTKSGLEMQSRDVGIGISQVLPVVVAALEPSASLVMVEQPELHIHPSVQVGLGDLLIYSVYRHNMNFLIETHSEHLILRLLRRIRETSAGDLPLNSPPVSPDMIGVYYVDRGENGVQIKSLPVDEAGEFTESWPKGFFDERAGELF